MIVGICLLQYTAFDQLKKRIIQRQRRKNAASAEDNSIVSLSAFSAFLLGAVSKSIATVLTYPLIRFANFYLTTEVYLGLTTCFCLLFFLDGFLYVCVFLAPVRGFLYWAFL
jgi:hypothetical protein